MNKVKHRAMSALLVAVLVLGGIGCTSCATSNTAPSGRPSPPTAASIPAVCSAPARSPTAAASCSRRPTAARAAYADDAAVRTACYQVVGDYTGNVGTGALKAFSKQLSGYNPITGTYATDGHTVALTLDSSLCVTAYEALAGRKGRRAREQLQDRRDPGHGLRPKHRPQQ